MNYDIPKFPSEVRQKAREALENAACWLKSVQIKHEWPYWTADAGRFLSLLHIKDDRIIPLPSICWNTARAAQALLSVYKINRDKDCLEHAKAALHYVKTCQIDDRFMPEMYQGGCREETSLCAQIATRDTIEAVQGFINMYLVTGEKEYLDRAIFSADWLMGRHEEDGTFPAGYYWTDTGKTDPNNTDSGRVCLSAEALIFSQLNTILGESRYGEKGYESINWVISNLLDADGGLRVHQGVTDDMAHHVIVSGPYADCITNDDGFGVSLIAAYRSTHEEKYREAVIKYGKWWLSQEQFPEKYSSIASVLVFLLDMYRFTGEKAYMDKALVYFYKVVELQHNAPGHPELHGGFKGHENCNKDEERVFPGDPLDYICLRTTMYSMIALGKIAADLESQWNVAYSAFGW